MGNVDGLPNVLLEAMAVGRPVVSTTIAGIHDVIADGENGLLVAAGSAEALADGLARLRADRSLGARLGAAALDKARALSWRSYGDQLLAGYERAIRASAQP